MFFLSIGTLSTSLQVMFCILKLVVYSMLDACFQWYVGQYWQHIKDDSLLNDYPVSGVGKLRLAPSRIFVRPAKALIE